MIEREISTLNARVDNLRVEHTTRQNEVNARYWKLDAALKRKLKNLKWFFLMSICLVVVVLIAIICEAFSDDIPKYGSLILSAGLCILLFFILKKNLNYKKNVYKEWDKDLVPANELKRELDEAMEKVTGLMIEMIINLKGQEVIDEIGRAYDDVYEYYDRLMNNEN